MVASPGAGWRRKECTYAMDIKQFEEEIFRLSEPSMDAFIRLSRNDQSSEKQDAKQAGWNKDSNILLKAEEQSAYMVAFGDSQRRKLNMVFQTLKDPTETLDTELSIVDWGAGQALATICLLDYMEQLGIKPNVKSITLIEPSKASLSRGQHFVQAKLRYLADQNAEKGKDKNCLTEVFCFNKTIDTVNSSDLCSCSKSLTVHLFSNVLDAGNFNFKQLANILTDCASASQLLFCAAQAGETSYGIEALCKELGVSLYKGNTTDLSFINLASVELRDGEAHLISTQGIASTILGDGQLKRVQDWVSRCRPVADATNKSLQFFRLALELESKKSPKIDDRFFPFHFDARGDKISSDIAKDEDGKNFKRFKEILDTNCNASKVKYPRNLYIGIGVNWNEKSYKLFRTIKLFEEFKGWDASKEPLECSLRDFEVDLNIASELSLDEGQVLRLNNSLQQQECTLQSCEDCLQKIVSSSITISNELVLTLCSDNLATVQVLNELRELEKNHIDNNSLLSPFLTNAPIENEEGHVLPEQLIVVANKGMDEYPRKAVTTALNNRVSVITGPPGTGKTQVILNLVANIIARGKTVFVASKNNMAVDNVKERFDVIDGGMDYVIRYGSKTVMNEQTLPALREFLQKITNINFDIDVQLLNDYQQNCERLYNISELKKRYEQLRQQKVAQQEHLIMLANTLQIAEAELTKLNEENCDKQCLVGMERMHILQNKDQLQNAKIRLQRKCSSSFKSFFFNLFHTSKEAEHLMDLLSGKAEINAFWENKDVSRKASDYHKGKELIDLCSRCIVFLDEALHYLDAKDKQESEVDTYKLQMEGVKGTLKDIEQQLGQIDLHTLSVEEKCIAQWIIDNSHSILNVAIKNSIEKKDTAKHIQEFLNLLENKRFPDPISTQAYLRVFKANAATSLSVRNAFPLVPELFDYVVIDEASQCDVASVLPLVYRTKHLVVIGDPLQLRHITNVDIKEEKVIHEHLELQDALHLQYKTKSLWDYCDAFLRLCKDVNRPVTLLAHYRCHKSIIDFSNQAFYARRLGKGLEVMTPSNTTRIKNEGLFWLNVNGKQKADNINVNNEEAFTAIDLATRLCTHYKEISIGIVTPFKDQASLLNSLIPQSMRQSIVADTVHKFQGDEKDIILYSLVVTSNTPTSKIRWINEMEENLMNVAVTRARHALYVIGNRDYLTSYIDEEGKNGTPLSYLLKMSRVVTLPPKKT